MATLTLVAAQPDDTPTIAEIDEALAHVSTVTRRGAAWRGFVDQLLDLRLDLA